MAAYRARIAFSSIIPDSWSPQDRVGVPTQENGIRIDYSYGATYFFPHLINDLVEVEVSKIFRQIAQPHCAAGLGKKVVTEHDSFLSLPSTHEAVSFCIRRTSPRRFRLGYDRQASIEFVHDTYLLRLL